MKFEIYFLNNIHDSLEVVNTEADCFIDLCEQNCYDACTVKQMILNLANCLELLVKYRLTEEHWSLIFSDINKAKYDDFISGNFISIDLKSGIKRLQNICNIKHDFTESEQIYKYRNSLMHYTLKTDSFEQVIKRIALSMCEVISFINEEIMRSIPEAAINDFANSIKEYQRYSDLLLKIDFTRANMEQDNLA